MILFANEATLLVLSASKSFTNALMNPAIALPNFSVNTGFNIISPTAPTIPIDDNTFRKSVIGFKSGYFSFFNSLNIEEKNFPIC